MGDLLKCSVCMSHFKDPVLLPCAHHICRDCMLGVLKQTRTCPFCRLEFIHRQVLNEFTGDDVMGVLQGSFDSMGIPLTQAQVLPSPPRPFLVKKGALNGNAISARRGRRRNRSAPCSFQPPLPFDRIPGPPEKSVERSSSATVRESSRRTGHRISLEVRRHSPVRRRTIRRTSLEVRGHSPVRRRTSCRTSQEAHSYSPVPRSSGIVWQVPKDYDPPRGIASLPALWTGLACDVACCTWPGINAQGGAAVVQACNNDGTYDVKYITDNRRELGIERRFIEAKPARSTSSYGQSQRKGLRRRLSMTEIKGEEKRMRGIMRYGRPDPCQPKRSCTGSRPLADGANSTQLIFVEKIGRSKQKKEIHNKGDKEKCLEGQPPQENENVKGYSEGDISCSSSFSVGDVVKVAPRLWPGINKRGGVARVVSCHPNGTCDVKYIVESSRKENVSTALLSLNNESPRREACSFINEVATKQQGCGSCKMVLCVSGLSLQSRGKRKDRRGDDLSRFVQNNSSSCQLVDSFTPEVTHLVMAEEDMKAPIRSMKYLRAAAKGIWILSPSWLAASLKSGFPVEEDAYELLGCHKERLEHAPRRSRTAHFSGSPPLFQGQSFTLSGSFGDGKCPKRQDLECLIIDSGGQLQESVGGYQAGIEVVKTITPALLRSAAQRNENPRWAIVTIGWLLDCVGNYHLFDINNVVPP